MHDIPRDTDPLRPGCLTAVFIFCLLHDENTKLWCTQIHLKACFSFKEQTYSSPLGPLASSMLPKAHSIWAPALQRYCLLDSINSPFVVSSTTLSPCGGRQEHKMPFWWRPASHVWWGNENAVLFFFLCLSHLFYVGPIYILNTRIFQTESQTRTKKKYSSLIRRRSYSWRVLNYQLQVEVVLWG